MAKEGKPIVPAGYNMLMPYIRVKGAADAIAFYTAAFGAKEKFHLTMGDKIGHAELKFGDNLLMLSEEFPDKGIVGPKSLGGTPCIMTLYVADVDKAQAKAEAAGAKVLQPAQDQFYGERCAKLEDPFGHVWSIQSHFEDVTPRQMQKRLDAMMGAAPSAKAAAKKKSSAKAK